jgi:hypothetical protein
MTGYVSSCRPVFESPAGAGDCGCALRMQLAAPVRPYRATITLTRSRDRALSTSRPQCAQSKCRRTTVIRGARPSRISERVQSNTACTTRRPRLEHTSRAAVLSTKSSTRETLGRPSAKGAASRAAGLRMVGPPSQPVESTGRDVCMASTNRSQQGPLPSAPPEAWGPLIRLRSVAGRPLERFLGIEAESGIVLLIAATAALVWANTASADSYVSFWHTLSDHCRRRWAVRAAGGWQHFRERRGFGRAQSRVE